MACIDAGINALTEFGLGMGLGLGLEEPAIDANKLSYEIFSILETKFLFGYDGEAFQKPKDMSPPTPQRTEETGDDAAPVKNQRGKVCILSLDAGGMRGIIPGKALGYLEDVLRRKSGNPEARIADYFDVIAGTGVGGIFAAMLVAGKAQKCFHADDTWKFLAAEGDKLYGSGKKRGGFFKRAFKKTGGGASATANLEKALKAAFTDKKTGRFLTLKDTLKPVLIPCYDLSSAAPFLFSRADALENDGYDFNLWEICLATVAEPGIFDPVTMKSIDGQTKCVGIAGAVAMSNPTAAAITHVLHNKEEFPFVRGVEDILVLSLGAGGQLLEGTFDYEQVKKWKSKDWARPLARISSDGAGDLVDHAVAMAFGDNRSQNYVRVQAGLGRCGVESDTDPGQNNVKMLVEMGEKMLKQKNVESVLLGGKKLGEQSNGEKLECFAEKLVQEHLKRGSRIAPTVAFKQQQQPVNPY